MNGTSPRNPEAANPNPVPVSSKGVACVVCFGPSQPCTARLGMLPASQTSSAPTPHTYTTHLHLHAATPPRFHTSTSVSGTKPAHLQAHLNMPFTCGSVSSIGTKSFQVESQRPHSAPNSPLPSLDSPGCFKKPFTSHLVDFSGDRRFFFSWVWVVRRPFSHRGLDEGRLPGAHGALGCGQVVATIVGW